MSTTTEQLALQKAHEWLKEPYDSDTRQQVKHLIDNNPKELTECFYKNLEFGTGGLRGIMGVGSNRMNKYTVGMATQGLANYLKKNFAGSVIEVVIAYDSRHNSRFFAEVTADVFAANNIGVYLFDSLRPTPELSFAIRQLGCKSGIVITASHNPKEYNGYKVYWDDGGQITAPHDKNIIGEVEKLQRIDDVSFNGSKDLIRSIGKAIDEEYLARLHSLSLSPEHIAVHSGMKIVYTPLHGTGVTLVPAILHKFGFRNIIHVAEQDVSDGSFPTLLSPNPEEASALKMAISKANEVDADLVMATDPDADRVGIAVRNNQNKMQLLNGNQTASILIYYLLRMWDEQKKLTGKEYIVKTIVTTDMLRQIAEHYKVDCLNVLTGFKYIAEAIRVNEGKRVFIAGGEESYGYLVGEYVRDKDAVMSCAMIAEAAAWAKSENKTLYQILLELYVKFGFFKEHLVSITKKGRDGLDEIKTIMKKFRETPPHSIAGERVVLIRDYLTSETIDMVSDLRHHINLPKSDVLQFITSDNTIVSIRPSGTEPKIKLYIGVRNHLASVDDFDQVNEKANKKIEAIVESLKLK